MRSISFRRIWQTYMQGFRQRAANEKALIPLSILGIAAGVITSAVILGFRWYIEIPLAMVLPGNNPENFEALSLSTQFALPLTGALVLGVGLQLIYNHPLRVGVAHVIERLNIHHGHLPLRNAVMQFFAGGIAIMSGQSAGREGPAVHLGSAASSLLGQYLQLPNNTIRVMVGCGTAAAIAASFNTPIAGVIFAMEVVMMEYTIAGFIPIILASVAGSILSQLAFGNDPAFSIPLVELYSLWELPLLIVLGIVIGAAAAAFIALMHFGLKFSAMAFWLRMLIAGLITATLAMVVPEIMGIGYDTLNNTLHAQYPLRGLLVIAAAKLIATASSSGLGMPIGIIGPNLLIGACLGGMVGSIGSHFLPELVGSQSLYVLLGMGAMMGAVLNAPLAALMALLELSNNPNLIMPGMLTIVAARLTTSEFFKRGSAHQTVLESWGALSQYSTLSHALARVGVTSVMSQDVKIVPPLHTAEELDAMLAQTPRWYVVKTDSDELLLSGFAVKNAWLLQTETNRETTIELVDLVRESKRLVHLPYQANLHEAWEKMNTENVDAAYIEGSITPYAPLVSGIITREDIENHYNSPRFP